MVTKTFALTLSQQDIYFDQLKQADSPLYNIGGYIRIGQLDVPRVNEAHRLMVESDSIFGIRVVSDAQGISQYITGKRDSRLPLVDFSDEENPQVAADEWLNQLFGTAFAVHEQPLFKSYLLKLDDEVYRYIGFAHHLIMDGWGFANIARRLSQLYNNCCDFEPHDDDWAGVSDSDQQYLDSKKYQRDMAFWQSQIVAAQPLLPRYYSGQFNCEQPVPSGRCILPVATQQVAAIAQLAKQWSVGQSHVYLALLCSYINLVYQEDDVLLGLPLHNRKNFKHKQMLGVFTGLNPLAVTVNPADSFAQLAQQMAQRQKASLRHQRFPIGHIPSNKPGRQQRLFDVGFNYLKLDSRLSFEGCDADLVYLSHHHESTPLMVTVWEYGEQCETQIQLDHNLAYFDHAEMRQVANRLAYLLEQVLTEGGEQPVAKLTVMPAQERLHLLEQLNDNQQPYQKHLCLHQLFEQHAQAHPNNSAVACDGQLLSYGELNTSVNQLAHCLIERHGVTPGTLVGVYTPRSTTMIIAVMAVLKAGGVYVPLNPEYPPERLAHMVNDTRMTVLLTEDKDRDECEQFGGKECQIVGLDSPALTQYSIANPVVDVNAGDPAYVIYTSGSTGLPKGVLCLHQSVNNLLSDFQSRRALGSKDNGSFWTDFCFDVSVYEIFSSLCSGAALHIVAEKVRLDAELFFDWLQEHQISSAYIPPFYLADFVEQVINGQLRCYLKRLLVGVEPIDQALLLKLQQHVNGLQIINGYGPSEATVCCSLYDIDIEHVHHMGITPIGSGVANSQLYVLDEQDELSPKGISGQLYVGGDGLALGYLNQPQLTAQSFIDSPFSPGAGQRLYKTGDRVRWRSDGQLVFLGRDDQQIKLHGVRIEPGEINHQLQRLELVDSSVVLVQNNQLVAYVKTSRSTADIKPSLGRALSLSLGQSLPQNMIPTVFVAIEQWPLTANGKIDKNALQVPAQCAGQSESNPPITATEQSLALIWGELLSIDPAVIARDAHFFELGGYSLLSIRMVSKIRQQLKAELSVKVIFETNSLQALAQHIDDCIDGSIDTATPVISPQGLTNTELSFAQQRLWFIDKLEGTSTQYNMPAAFMLQGKFDVGAGEQAIRALIERHQILRTCYIESEIGVRQHIKRTFDFVLRTHDLSDVPVAQQQSQLQALVDQDANRPFDLATDLMIRVSYVKCTDVNNTTAKGALLFNMHHIAGDGWSMDIVVAQFSQYYRAIVAGEPLQLTPLLIQYSDYAVWQRQWHQDESFGAQLDYWQTQLADVPAIHGLMTDYPRPAVKQTVGEQLRGELPSEVASSLIALAKHHQLTPFMLLHGLLALVLARHANQTDIVIGTPVANRLHSELEPLIGCFVNTLVLRVDTDHHQLADYLAHVRRVHLAAQSNQQIPFEQLVELLNLPRTTAHSPLCQIMLSSAADFDVSNKPLSLPGVELTRLLSEQVSVKMDLEIDVDLSEQGLKLNWTFDRALFSRNHIHQLNDHLCRLLTGLVEGPISHLPMLSSDEQHYLLNTLNQNTQSYDKSQCLHHLFESQAAAQPNAIAVVYDDQSLTFGELNAQANQLAHYLIEQHQVKPQTLVGLCVQRSTQMIVGLLAILKAGGGYVPMSPQFPKARLSALLDDGDIKVVLGDTDFDLQEAMGNSRRVVDLKGDCFAGFATDNPVTDVTSADVAYVIYTSGSTGLPKGVECLHYSVNNLLSDFQSKAAIVPGDNGSFWTDFCFDVSVYEIFSALCHGAALHIVPEGIRLDCERLFDWMQTHQISSAYLPPFYLQDFALWLAGDKTSQLNRLLVGVEPIDQSLLLEIIGFIAPLKVINGYGPSEATVCCSLYSVPQTPLTEQTVTPIGTGVANTWLYVLDDNACLLPKGVCGQLYVGGDGLARGYLNKPQLTNQAFIDNPYHDGDNPQRLYKTGDWVRWREDGQLAFSGRVDHQVKINGYRIEPAEVSHQLTTIAGVQEAVVLVSDNQMLAYVQSTVDIALVKQSLQAILPAYMVPSVFVAIKQWPRTANGKIDRKALPKPAQSLSQYVAPQTPTQVSLVCIWSTLLQKAQDEIGLHSDFFALGGHSLLSVRLVSEIRKQLQCELSVKTIFECPTIQTLADHIDEAPGIAVRSGVTALGATDAELSFAQQRLWFIDRLDSDNAQYNMSAVFRVNGAFDVKAAEQALTTIIERHQILRTVYQQLGEGSIQHIRDEFDFSAPIHDLRGLQPSQQQMQLDELIEADGQQPFDLTEDVMLRAGYVMLDNDEGVLLFNMHHIASDGWSVDVLMQEFSCLYQANLSGQPHSLPVLAIQYADYAHWQRQWLQGDVLASQKAYWLKQLEDVPPMHGLLLDNPRPTDKQAAFEPIAAQFTGQLAPSVVNALTDLAKTHQLTPFMLLHGALSLVLARHSNNNDIVIGTPVANRLQSELEPLIGFFVNTLVLRVDTDHNQLHDYFEHVRKVHLDAQSNQDVPFEQLVEWLDLPRSTTYSPLVQILLTTNTDYGRGDHQLSLPGVTLTPMNPGHVAAKVDLEIGLNFCDEGLALQWTYDSSIFNEQHIALFNSHLCRLLIGMSGASDASDASDESEGLINQLPMLSDEEQHYLTHTLNQTSQPYDKTQCLHQLFEAQAAAQPNNIAVVYDGQSLTYGELNARANQVAHYLVEQHQLKPQTLVGLCVRRSCQMIVGLLAILKAGCGYVPMSGEFPRARLIQLLDDSDITLVLSETDLLGLDLHLDLEKTVAGSRAVVDLNDDSFNECATDNPVTRVTSSDTAYVIYTSGSTGLPKGVECLHYSVNNLLSDFQRKAEIGRTDASAFWTDFCFDVSVYEIFSALCHGTALHIVPDAIRLDDERLFEWMQTHQITSAYLPPFYLQGFAAWLKRDNTSQLKRLLVGVEPIDQSLLLDITASIAQLQVINGYGPSEATVCCTLYAVPAEPLSTAQLPLEPLPAQVITPIGFGVANTRLYVLDDNACLLPFGVCGQLYVGGDGLARGYLNNPKLTSQAFIDDPFVPDSRIYKTGDWVRYLDDGTLVFVGRGDHQLKIRGFRIEPGEIEQQIRQCEGVDSALVMGKDDNTGTKQLVAYVQRLPAHLNDVDEVDEVEFIADLQKTLAAKMPSYMVPAAVVMVTQWPLTPNGKVDKKALPEVDIQMMQGEYVAPVNDVERLMVQMCAELLGLEADQISTTANFFKLGGHSLLVLRLIANIEQQFGVDIEVKALFEFETLADLAFYIDIEQTLQTRSIDDLSEEELDRYLAFMDQM